MTKCDDPNRPSTDVAQKHGKNTSSATNQSAVPATAIITKVNMPPNETKVSDGDRDTAKYGSRRVGGKAAQGSGD